MEAALIEVIDTAGASSCGGWATAGTQSDPHWIMYTMDGAGCTHSTSGVRVSFFAGSVRKMNQFRHGVRNLATYQASTMAEDHSTLMLRLDHVRPHLNRIFRCGYVSRADSSKVFVKFMVTADKSGICHLMGRRNMNHDCFGTQCDCKDSNDEMYDLTKDPLTHYDRVTFAIRYGRGHMAEHEALDMPEPEDWCVECDVCGRLPKAAILKERAERAAMSEDESTKYEEAHSKKHFGQCIDQEPVLPYHDSCTDVLHLYLNLVKAAVAHVFHKPFQIEKANYSKEVKEVMSKVRDELNARMKQDFDDKKFGGEGVFSLIGDQVKIFMRGGHNHRLVPDLLAIAEPYFSLLRSDGLVPDDPAPAQAAEADQCASKGRGKGRPPTKGKGKGGRGGGGRGGAARGRGRGGGRGTSHARRTVRAVEQPESSDEEEGEEAAAAAAEKEPAATAPTEASYKEKVVAMFLSLSAHWLFTHSINDRDAKEILRPEREKLARKAYDFGCDVVQAVCAVCGDEQRQTYLHDIAYGLQKLFPILGKPYLGGTEGNESAHQELKKDFHQMCCHSNKRAGDMLQLMRLHHLRKVTFAASKDFAPRNRYSEATLGMELGLRDPKRIKKAADSSIPVADGHLKALIEPPIGEPRAEKDAETV